MTAKIHKNDQSPEPHFTHGREMAHQRLVFNTTEDILLAMEDLGFNQADLARKMGKSAAHVSKILDGTRNMTLNTLADISYALGVDTRVRIYLNGVDVSHVVPPQTTSYFSDLSKVCDPEPFKLTIHINKIQKAIL